MNSVIHAEYHCGCKVFSSGPGHHKIGISWCPLHTGAKETLSTLDRVKRTLDECPDEHSMWRLLTVITEEAIRKATDPKHFAVELPSKDIYARTPPPPVATDVPEAANLRDWFAIHAPEDHEAIDTPDQAARAYRYADAMMAARLR